MSGGSNGRYGGPLYGGEPIEPELMAIARRLDHDGDTWRRGLPDEQHAARRVIAATASAATTTARTADPLAQSDERGMWGGPDGGGNPTRPRSRGPQRAQRLLAVAAMLLVVVLLAVVLKALGARQAAPHPTATATATTAPTATSTPAFPGAWSVAGTITTAGQPVFAPSDPRVAYYAAVLTPGNPGPSTTSVILQRTDDAGKTWQSLATPPGLVVDSHLLDLHAVVSRFDAHTVFLYSARSAASCAPHGDPSIQAGALGPIARQGSGSVCLTQYRSGDGGVSWNQLTLPLPGIIAQAVYDGNGTLYSLVAQPQYGAGSPDPPDRLLASTDGGLTWHVADAPLWAQGYGVVSVIVAPSVANTDRLVSMWAVTNPVALSQSQQASPQFQLWRSDDAGTTWRLTRTGSLPYRYSPFLVAGAGTLYQLAPQPQNQGGQTLADGLPAVSTDGGATWNKPATTGLRSSFSLANAQPVVAGAAIIVPFFDGSDTVFYEWLPGAASWREVAPPLKQESLGQLFAVSSNGRTTLWAVYGNTVASFMLS